MANESYVRISEVLKDAPALASAATEFVVAGAIKAKYGDFEPTLIRSRKELLSKYVCDGKLTGMCDVSLINAYEILGSAPILVCRAASQEYNPITLEDTEVGMQFALEFTDFMFDPNNYGVRVYLRPSQSYPGANELNVKYIKFSDIPIYPYSLSESSDQGVLYEGPKLEVGSELILFSESGNSEITVRVKDISEDGAYGDEYMVWLELLTTLGEQDSETVFEDSDYGLSVRIDIGDEIESVVKEYNVLFALDESVTDDKGNSLYYENVWNISYPFKINITGTPEMCTIPNPYKAKDPTQPDILSFLWYGPNGEVDVYLDSTVDYEPPYIPMSLYYDPNTQTLEDEVNDPYGVHWERLHAYEDRNIPLFTDFGVPNVGSQLKSLADQFSGIYCISLPRLSESVNGARAWDDLDLGNSRRYACTPFALTTNLGFLAQIAPTTQYIKTICTNAIAGREFEAVAGRVTGIAAYSRLTKKYNKYEREELLDLKINTITYKEVDGYAMFNDDLTGLVQNNPFKEEFNRRLGVRISQDVNTLMKQFLFQLNTKSLRDTVESTLNAYFNTAPFKSKIYAFEVKCDDENNPPSLQAQNKLAVIVNIAFYYTAKYIEVVNNIYSVGQSFTE